MKRSLFLLLTFTLLGTATIAQSTHPFRIGLKVNPSIGWISPETNDMMRDGMAVKFGYGLVADYWFTNRYALASGIIINGVGGSVSLPAGQDSVYYLLEGDKHYLINRKYLLNYVEIPVTIKLRTNEIGYMTYYGQFGMNIGLRAKARADDEVVLDGSSSVLTKTNIDIENDVSLVKLGLNVGIGTEYTVSGSTSILFGLNYHNGFTNILKHKSNALIDTDGTQYLQKALSHQVSLSVGVIF